MNALQDRELARDRMFEEEAQHFPRRVRASRIGVGAGGAAVRPRVAGTVNVPVLRDLAPAAVGKDGAGVGMAWGTRPRIAFVFGLLASADCLRTRSPLFGCTVVSRSPWKTMVGAGDPLIRNYFAAATLPHGDERGGKIAGGAAGQAGMYADRRVQFGVRRSHDGGSGAAGRQASDVDALRIDRIVPHDLTGDAGDYRGFTTTPLLVACANQFQHFAGLVRWAVRDRPRNNSALPPGSSSGCRRRNRWATGCRHEA